MPLSVIYLTKEMARLNHISETNIETKAPKPNNVFKKM